MSVRSVIVLTVVDVAVPSLGVSIEWNRGSWEP
jgi:hypothetical protein